MMMMIKNKATANGQYNTTSAIHCGCYSKRTTRHLEAALFPPCSAYSNADISST